MLGSSPPFAPRTGFELLPGFTNQLINGGQLGALPAGH